MPSSTEREPQRLGDFEIVGELGRGGMGVVYEARQISLNRKVALKVLSSGLGLTSQAIARFQREAEAAAKLHHTNIVPVYATGAENGTHFYAMELIDGVSLDRVLQQLRQEPARSDPASTVDAAPSAVDLPPWVTQTFSHGVSSGKIEAPNLGSSSTLSADSHYFDTVASMVAEVADALEHAHQHGVIHRDVKPSNLLLSREGRLSLNDFGLARILEQPGMTLTGELVGTPRYMSPEQVAVGRIPLDHRMDIYSLGATLYELLTLQPPFAGERRDQVLAQILHEDPRAPRRLNRKAPADLETICLKAMDKNPDRRYATARQMADDLRCYVNRFAISARRAGPIERLRKWVRRRPGLAAAVLAMTSLSVAAGFFAYQAYRESLERQDERRQSVLERGLLSAMRGDFQDADKAADEAELLGTPPGLVRMLRGQVALHRSDMKAAVAHLEQAAKLLPESVSAQALLALAYFDAWDILRTEEAVLKVEKLTPETPEDFVFKGRLEGVFDPEKGLRTMEEAIRRKDSPLARLARAEVRAMHALGTGRAKDALLAVEDASRAKGMLPDSPVALAKSILAHLTLASVLQAHEQKAALGKAEADVQALAELHVPAALEARIRYFSFREDDDGVINARRRSRTSLDMPGLDIFCALSLYRRGRPADINEAIDIMDRHRTRDFQPYVELIRGVVLAEVPERRGEAEADLEAAAQKTPAALISSLYPQTALRLLGRKDKAIKASLRLREDTRKMPSWRGWYGHLLDYNCGELSEKGLLDHAGASRLNLCEAHFFMGLTCLADGDRPAARAHFEKSVATRVFLYVDYDLSRSFLARLTKDPSWPPWILSERCRTIGSTESTAAHEVGMLSPLVRQPARQRRRRRCAEGRFSQSQPNRRFSQSRVSADARRCLV